MPAKYHVIAKKNPRNPEAPPRYYPSFVTRGRMSLRELCNEISDYSTVSSAH